MHRQSRKIIQLTKEQESSYCSKIIFHPALEIIRNSKGYGHSLFPESIYMAYSLKFLFWLLVAETLWFEFTTHLEHHFFVAQGFGTL